MSAVTLESLRPQTAQQTQAPPVSPAPVKRKLPFPPRTAIAVGLALVLAVGGGAWILLPKSEEQTNAAYVEADSSIVAPRVRGVIAEVLVKHNESVKAGQPLVRLDPE